MREILAYVGEPISPSPMALARGPPLREMPDAAPTECDPRAQPAPDYEFDERIAWQVPRQGKPPRLRFRLVMGQLVLGVSRAANAGRPAAPGSDRIVIPSTSQGLAAPRAQLTLAARARDTPRGNVGFSIPIRLVACADSGIA